MKLFSVRDLKSGSFSRAFSDTDVHMACRGFESVVNRPDSQYGQFPDDFALFELGSYDPQTGMVMSNDTPTELVRARSVLRSNSPVVQ